MQVCYVHVRVKLRPKKVIISITTPLLTAYHLNPHETLNTPLLTDYHLNPHVTLNTPLLIDYHCKYSLPQSIPILATEKIIIMFISIYRQ